MCVFPSDYLLNLVDEPFSITFEDTPPGQRMRVLQVSVLDMMVSNKYGFVRKDVIGMKEARFD